MNVKLLKFWIGRIVRYMRTLPDFRIDPLPTVNFLDEEGDPDDILTPTGNYDYSTRTINLYTCNRHVKDVLRSFCHEMVHHHQYLDNPGYFPRVDKSGPVSENAELRELESEAYMLGNLYFRQFTETFTER